MRLAYLSSIVVPSYRADGVQVMHMCEAFAHLGHTVTLWAQPGSEPADDFMFYGVDRRFEIVKVSRPRLRLGLGDRLYARRVRRSLREHPPIDLLYARHAPALFAAAGNGVPLVLEVHHPAPDPIYARAERRVLAHPDFRLLVTISMALARDYAGRFPTLGSTRIIVAPDAAAPPAPSPPPATPGMPRAALRVGYAGSLLPGRGIELILDVARSMPECEFHIVGGAAEEAGRWVGMGVPANVEFFERVTPAFVSRVLDRWDVLVAPYQARVSIEGGRDTARWMSPLKIFEYMAAGKAIVASDLPALREVLTDRETALLVSPGNVADWIAALGALRDDPALRARLGGNAQRVWRERFTWERRAEAVLEKLGGQGRARAGDSGQGHT